MLNLFKQIKHKKIWFPLIALSIISLFYISSYTTPSSSKLVGPTPTPSGLQVTNVYPPPDSRPGLILPNTTLIIDFNQPVTLDMVTIHTNPSKDFTYFFSVDAKTLYARPTTPWIINQLYQLSVTTPANKKLSQTSFAFYDPAKVVEMQGEFPPGGI